MFNKAICRSLALLLSISLIYTPLLRAEQLALPSGDVIAPVVKHKKLSDYIVQGQNYSIEATVTDNGAVKSVSLFYRQVGSTEYQRVYMKQVEGTDVYVTTLNKQILTPPGIEYYIQAMDVAGNSLLHGYSFAPLNVNVTAQVKETINKPLAGLESENDSSSNKWWWIGLGVLAAAAAASSGGGGGDDGAAQAGASVVVIAPLP